MSSALILPADREFGTRRLAGGLIFRLIFRRGENPAGS
jgi:hypothetical protein